MSDRTDKDPPPSYEDAGGSDTAPPATEKASAQPDASNANESNTDGANANERSAEDSKSARIAVKAQEAAAERRRPPVYALQNLAQISLTGS